MSTIININHLFSMKSYLILFSATLFFASCSQDDALQNTPESVGVVERTASDNYDYIEQLVTQQIPVNIYLPENVANDTRMYLSGKKETNRVGLWSVDKGTGQEKFYIQKTKIVNGKQYYKIIALGGVWKNKTWVGDEPAYTEPVLWDIPPKNQGDWYFELLESTNKYRIIGPNSGGRYLQAISYGNRYLKMDKKLPTFSFADWFIVPINDLEIVSISYFLTSDNRTIERPSFITEATVVNRSDTQQSMTFSFSSTASETSNFSKTRGASLTVGAAVKVGIPLFAAGTLNTSTTTSQSWTYGKSEAKSETRSYSFPVVVPGRTTLTAKAVVSMYDVSAKYVIEYRVKGIEKTIKLQGEWVGIKAGAVNYEIYDSNSKQLLRKISETPTSKVIL